MVACEVPETVARMSAMPVIAEGVEKEEQRLFLKLEGCNEIQGFLIGSPRPIAEYAAQSGKDERDVLEAVKRIVGPQVDALNTFTDEVERGEYEGREDALSARAALYAGGIKSAYWSGKVDGSDIPCVPGSCPECYSNCRCELEVKEDGIYWQCVEDRASCASCVQRGNEWQPWSGE